MQQSLKINNGSETPLRSARARHFNDEVEQSEYQISDLQSKEAYNSNMP